MNVIAGLDMSDLTLSVFDALAQELPRNEMTASLKEKAKELVAFKDAISAANEGCAKITQCSYE